jgi:2-deoxystreptamine N-acetyl-D-glucosaminyltransferase/2-deoxystreptamine glucosyltransferase
VVDRRSLAAGGGVGVTDPDPALRVLRICSVFETPVVAGRAAGFDPVGGMQHHTGQLTRALDALGVVQTVVTAYRPGVPRFQTVGRAADVHRLGIPVRRLRQLYSLPAARRVRQHAGAVDLVHAHLGEDLAVLPLAASAARRAGIPLVMTVHCSLRHTVTAGTAPAALLRTVGGRLERWAEDRADAVIVLTPTMAGRLADDGVPAERIHVVPSGADPARFAGVHPDPRPDLGRPRIVFVGRLGRQKGVETLIDAVPHLRHDVPVVIVGDGPLRGALEERARRLGVSSRVTFTGFVPHAEVPAHLRHADLLVLPSAYEELGSILVEALHAGLPVVASAVGGIPDIVRDGVTGRLFPAGDARALAVAVDELVGHPVLLAAFAAAARRAAPDYSWDGLARRVLGLYRSTLVAAAAR